MESTLQALGIDEVDERIYRTLLRLPGTTVAELSNAIGRDAGRVRRALASLERCGLVTRTPAPTARFLPVPPNLGIDALVRRKEHQLDAVRRLAETLMAQYRESARVAPTELIEILSGTDAVLDRFDQLQRQATTEIQVMDTPPYASSAGPATNDVEFDVLSRGVTCKAIYDRAALEQSPGAMHAIARYIAAGEQARVTSQLPLKLATFDRKLAFVPQSLGQQDVAGAIVVHECSLLDVLLYVFDQMWSHATPLSAEAPFFVNVPGERDDPMPDERRLLALLASGMKDEAIAHHLGWSYRTTRRRIAGLLTNLKAGTRFQAGLHAARRGWL
ncbi:helix-turn-helix domain-containing protein [Streptomyces sp. NPDC056512]|uniref:helix-turn-helix domain-containing protein n=1 Tax=Streptomyces sp. NPDC056512 TaxID=3345846 RepID=UPI0036B2934F